MDASGAADESVLLRTAKSCGPDASMVGVKFSRSKLLGGDGDNKARSPGSTKETVKTIACGNAGCSGATVVTNARAIYSPRATREISRNVQQVEERTHQVATNILEVNRCATQTGTAASAVLHSAQALTHASGRLRQELDRFHGQCAGSLVRLQGKVRPELVSEAEKIARPTKGSEPRLRPLLRGLGYGDPIVAIQPVDDR